MQADPRPESSTLQEDLLRERRDRCRLEAELEMERGELNELQERFIQLQVARFQTDEQAWEQ